MIDAFPCWRHSRLPPVRVLNDPREVAAARLDDWTEAQREHPTAPDLTEHVESEVNDAAAQIR